MFLVSVMHTCMPMCKYYVMLCIHMSYMMYPMGLWARPKLPSLTLLFIWPSLWLSRPNKASPQWPGPGRPVEYEVGSCSIPMVLYEVVVQKTIEINTRPSTTSSKDEKIWIHTVVTSVCSYPNPIRNSGSGRIRVISEPEPDKEFGFGLGFGSESLLSYRVRVGFGF